LLINLWTGRRPTKRTHEMLCYYLMGGGHQSQSQERIQRC